MIIFSMGIGCNVNALGVVRVCSGVAFLIVRRLAGVVLLMRSIIFKLLDSILAVSKRVSG